MKNTEAIFGAFVIVCIVGVIVFIALLFHTNANNHMEVDKACIEKGGAVLDNVDKYNRGCVFN